MRFVWDHRSLSKPAPIFVGPDRQFAQARARRTFEALVAAASDVFAERGFDATQTPDIAAAAGVSTGTFYNYFSDKLEIYLEVARRELGDAYHRTLGQLTPERFADKGNRAVIAETLAILFDHVTTHPASHRVFIEMSLRDPDVAALKQAFDREARARLTELLTAICTRTQVPDPEATAFIIHAAAVETANSIVGVAGASPLDRERAQNALTEVVYRALFGVPSRGPTAT